MTSNDYQIAAAIVCIASSFCTSLLFGYSLIRMLQNQQLAYNGDAKAAKRIILPCFKPLFRALIGLFFGLGCVQLIALVVLDAYGMKFELFAVVQLYGLCLLILYCISPVLLQQASISFAAFRRTAAVLATYFVVCFVVWIVSVGSMHRSVSMAMGIVFWLLTFLPPASMCAGLLTHRIKSRMHTKSWSNRGTTDYLAVYSLLYGLLNISVFLSRQTRNSDPSPTFLAMLELYVVIVFIISLFFPFAFYRALLADTKFWRGIGRHNEGGIRFSDSIQRGELQTPTIEMNVLTSSFQDMISNLGDALVIDFAFLRIADKIGDGATAEVYKGMYRNDTLAIKISTPPEVTPDVISVFADEASVSASLSSCPQILQFHGICIRPPQIAMVVQLCSRGDLRTSLVKHAALWTVEKKLLACLDAAKALAYMHSKRYIHRDVKAANFFVTEDLEVKLGDFGETCEQQDAETTTKENRMAILGTVAFMAPELIAAKIHYTEAVDVYAYAVMMWEIWTDGGEPWGDVTTFKTYELVGKGERPDTSNFVTTSSVTALNGEPGSPAGKFVVPAGVLELMQLAWHQDPAQRLSAADIASKLVDILVGMYEANGMTGAAEAFLAAQQAEPTPESSGPPSARSSLMSTLPSREMLAGKLMDTLGRRDRDRDSVGSVANGSTTSSKSDSNSHSPSPSPAAATTPADSAGLSAVSNPMQQQQQQVHS